MNRSLEAHLANFGIHEGYGTGNVDQDPGGYLDTIDPAVDVLRVDKLVGGRDVPVGVWSSFANHGTVDKATYTVYNGDHQASADRAVESAIRAAGAVPSAQEVVSAFANADEGDQTSGIRHSGPADAERVGDVEAHVLLDAWTEAGKALSTDLPLDMRWTRISLSGVSTSTGHAVGTDPVTGLSLFTGSEEGRGPLYDITGQVNGTNFEGVKAPVDNPVDGQGDKVEVRTALPSMSTAFPHVLPITVLRLGDRLVATIPGEMTVAMAKRVRAAVLQAASALPIHGSAAPADDDARNGVTTGSGAAAFPTGATSATITGQPATTERLAQSVFSWQGAALGADMPVGRAFVTVRRLDHGSWTPVADDLGLQIVWRVDDSGQYNARWEVPLDIPTGDYEMVVTANQYSLTSAPFTVVPSTRLVLAGTNAQLHVGYPAAVENVDVTARPVSVAGGTISSRPFSGATVSAGAVPAGAVQDAYGNCNGSAFGEAGSVSACPKMDVLGAGAGAGGNGAVEALPNTAGAPSGGPAGLFAGAAVGVVAGLSRGGGRRRARPRIR